MAMLRPKKTSAPIVAPKILVMPVPLRTLCFDEKNLQGTNWAGCVGAHTIKRATTAINPKSTDKKLPKNESTA
jgi:hypothetical protein